MGESQPMVHSNYQDSGKNRYIAAFLAWFLGGFGAHKFYIGQRSTAKRYLIFFWTFIPAFYGLAHAAHYLMMDEEEFHRRITMDEADFESWSEAASEDPDATTTFEQQVAKTKEEQEAKKQAKREEKLATLPDDYLKLAKSDYVTEERVLKVADILDNDEPVYYITEGSTIDVEGSSAGSSLFGDDRGRKSGTKGYVRAAFTDNRVAIKIPQVLGDDERSVPYHSITSVDLDTGLRNKRISLQTPGQTYHIEAFDPDKDECREITRYIREKISEINQQETVVTQETDPTEQLQNLKELHEQGAISDEQFEEKQEALLDKIE